MFESSIGLKPDMQVHFTLAADNVTATELSASRPPD